MLEFEDRNASTIASLDPPDIGIYHDLLWRNFRVVLEQPLAGIAATSGQQYAASTSEWIAHKHEELPAITCHVPRRHLAIFDVVSFHFGCSVPSPSGSLQIAQACILHLEGFAGSSKAAVENAMFYFGPFRQARGGAMRSGMANVQLRSEAFNGLQTLTFNVSGADGAVPLLMVDDVKLRVYEVTRWEYGPGDNRHEGWAV
ncbi:hypothetical protein FH972_021038 [Carpinus fangiana]|uniref:Uncharacterized protein n=1 Tax=Carpinus fangiana TaxID=176857 RepID=A0A5N6KNR2_9ROSI|nr:hypothetical protein FH972_021038 [Carpinus fangiana]